MALFLEPKNFRPPPSVARERREEPRHGDLLKSLTVDLITTYQQCSTDFVYSDNTAPKRVLTKLSKGVYNDNFDNAEHDYICRVGDKIVNPDGHAYEILERLGHGTFGQVLKTHHSTSNSHVALKIIKNKPAYFHQALVEVRILQMLNQEFDPDDDKRIVRMLDFFVYRKHLCIAFELLSVNLYEVLKQNSFRGVSMALIRVLTDQLLKALRCLRDASVIHCDLKPENVLLSNIHHTRIKLIDFGSACFESHTVYPYIQSRFYRSPEVLLGVPYTSAIDMWSLGCICAELFLGLPVFPGHSEYNQVCRIVEVLRLPPSSLLDAGRNTRRYFRKEAVAPQVDKEDGAEGASSEDHSQAQDPREGEAQSSSQGGLADEDAKRAHEDPNELPKSKSPEQKAMSPKGEDSFCVVSGAGGDGSICNGEYRKVGDHNDKPMYKKIGGNAIIYFDESWKINACIDTGGWYYIAPDAASSTPPEGQWTTDPSMKDAHPPPVISTRKAASKSGSFLDLLRHRLGWEGMGNVETDKPCASDAPEPNATAEASTATSAALETQDGGSVHGGRRLGDERDTTEASEKEASSFSDAACAHAELKRKLPRQKSKRQTAWRLKTKEEYERDEHKKEPVPKKYFNFCSLEEMVNMVPFRSNLGRRSLKEEQDRRLSFLQFLTGLLQLNPDYRWTPMQASEHPFIMGYHYDPDWRPALDRPVPSFKQAVPPSRLAEPASGVVPLLPSAKLRPAPGSGEVAEGTGGGSARTCDEKKMGPGLEEEHPQSAPASTRDSMGQSKSAELAGAGSDAKVPKAALRGLWGHLCMGIPLPDDNPAESYRPPIDKMSERFFSSFMEMAEERKRRSSTETSEAADFGGASPPKASAGASFCSSASSTGSTPTGRHAMQRTVASPLLKNLPSDLRLSGGRPNLGGTAPTTSPHGSLASTAAGPSLGSGRPASGPLRGGSGASGLGPGRASRGGSRGSSPWHLPSPMSELSTASERLNSSQPSGSDSCGEPGSDGASAFEDQRHSESEGSPFPGPYGGGSQVEAKDISATMWETVKHEMSRVELGRDRLPRRLDIQSPGTTGTLPFREAIGMNDNGPVIPRRDPHTMRTPSSSSQTNPNEEPGGPAAGSQGSNSGSNPGLSVLNAMSRSVDGHLGLGGFTTGATSSTRRKGKRP
ncbi:ppk15 [Symbiodinium natans]|uniref:Ppk15 protein n=1 Tax=Symbiodinium natans TaxID=878477 RepID=A0A812PBR9_9DINO|nr:ppk15 [Symbiodinium natans]